jgi:hypothetical protein
MTPWEIVSKLASILANGYLRHVKARRFMIECGLLPADVAQPEKSQEVTENRLDSSGRRSLHSTMGLVPREAAEITWPRSGKENIERRFQMNTDTYKEIMSLSRMTVGELWKKYLEVFGEETLFHHKDFLRKRIA